jgi:hypothetical protein
MTGVAAAADAITATTAVAASSRKGINKQKVAGCSQIGKPFYYKLNSPV